MGTFALLLATPLFGHVESCPGLHLLTASPFDSPRRPRVKGNRVPTFAAGGDTALLKEGLKRVRAFRQSYRDCMQRFLAGARDVVFPADNAALPSGFRRGI
jgi:hypothetical protein